MIKVTLVKTNIPCPQCGGKEAELEIDSSIWTKRTEAKCNICGFGASASLGCSDDTVKTVLRSLHGTYYKEYQNQKSLVKAVEQIKQLLYKK